MRSFDPRQLERRQRNNLINGLIYPRPIAWVSTIASDGARNLAPFSFFNVFGEEPPVVGFAINDRRPGDRKDTGKRIHISAAASGKKEVRIEVADNGPGIAEVEKRRIFNEFAVVVTTAIVASAFVSLTLTPMLAAKILRQPERNEQPIWWSKQFERGFEAYCGGTIEPCRSACAISHGCLWSFSRRSRARPGCS